VAQPIRWISDVISFLDISPTSEQLSSVTPYLSFINPYENKSAHRRSGIPGVGRNVLTHESLLEIDALFEDFYLHFSYPRPDIEDRDLNLIQEICSLRDSVKLLMKKNADLQNALHKTRKLIDKYVRQS
jgi:hypothetical protein